MTEAIGLLVVSFVVSMFRAAQIISAIDPFTFGRMNRRKSGNVQNSMSFAL